MNRSQMFPGKLDHMGTTIFSVMSAMAQQHQAINLSQGFPNFDCDPRLVELVHKAMLAGHNQYAPMPGVKALREQISLHVQVRGGISYDPESEVTITCGATEALYGVMATFLHPGDEVIILEPAYDAYWPAILANGGTPVPVPLTFPDYRIDWDRVEAAISTQTRALVLNTPHNPTGTCWQATDLVQLKSLLTRHDLLVISDEVYEYMVYDGEKHLSITQDPDVAQRSVVISSFGKTLHTTGWKVGYVLAPEAMSRSFRYVHQFLTFAIGTPFQHGIAAYLATHDDMLRSLNQFYQAKRDAFLAHMHGSGFEPLPCAGTYFQLMRYEQIRDMPERAFVEWLTKEVGVAAIPVSAFYHDQTDHRVLRFCFAKDEETLAKAGARLRSIN